MGNLPVLTYQYGPQACRFSSVSKGQSRPCGSLCNVAEVVVDPHRHIIADVFRAANNGETIELSLYQQ